MYSSNTNSHVGCEKVEKGGKRGKSKTWSVLMMKEDGEGGRRRRKEEGEVGGGSNSSFHWKLRPSHWKRSNFNSGKSWTRTLYLTKKLQRLCQKCLTEVWFFYYIKLCHKTAPKKTPPPWRSICLCYFAPHILNNRRRYYRENYSGTNSSTIGNVLCMLNY